MLNHITVIIYSLFCFHLLQCKTYADISSFYYHCSLSFSKRHLKIVFQCCSICTWTYVEITIEAVLGNWLTTVQIFLQCLSYIWINHIQGQFLQWFLTFHWQPSSGNQCCQCVTLQYITSTTKSWGHKCCYRSIQCEISKCSREWCRAPRL